MTSEHQETDAEFDAFLAGVDRALTAQYGPDHQEVLSASRFIHRFKWDGIKHGDGGSEFMNRPKRIDPG